MIIHVLIDVAQKARCNDTYHPKRDASQIDIVVALRVGHPARIDDHLIRRLVASNPGNLANALDERYGSKLDGVGDGAQIRDVELRGHDAADVGLRVGDEFRDEDIEVDGVADCAADDADRERQRRDGSDQVVRADDRGHDGRGHHDAADPQPGEDKKPPQLIEVVGGGCGETATAGCHEDAGDDHEFFVVAVGAEEPENNAGAGEDAKAKGEATDADADGIVAVDVEGLRWPEYQNAEEVRPGDECDDEDQGKDSRLSLQAGREHWVLGAIGFPDAEDSEQACPKQEGDKDMCRRPGVLRSCQCETEGTDIHGRTHLIPAPHETSHE